MTNEEEQLVMKLGHMSVEEMNIISQDVLCVNIRQLLEIIANMSFGPIKSVGPTRVLRVESSLPLDPITVIEKKKEAGRAHDGLV